jgi:cellulose synthase/poly-beta-1,6-N-acetylglucosamine synthase-like glycosyltransferase
VPAALAAFRLEYVKEAIAEADPVTKLTGLMKQRRRWLNGTFFAMLYALSNMGRIWTESGELLRLCRIMHYASCHCGKAVVTKRKVPLRYEKGVHCCIGLYCFYQQNLRRCHPLLLAGHSVFRKLALTVEFAYLVINMVVGTWCAGCCSKLLQAHLKGRMGLRASLLLSVQYAAR